MCFEKHKKGEFNCGKLSECHAETNQDIGQESGIRIGL